MIATRRMRFLRAMTKPSRIRVKMMRDDGATVRYPWQFWGDLRTEYGIRLKHSSVHAI